MASTPSTAVAKPPTESPYRLDRSQVLRASDALLKHVKSESKRKEAAAPKKNLLAADDEDSDDDGAAAIAEPLWLVMTTKKHIIDQKRLKPGKIPIPHTLNTSATSSICLITPDPQRTFKDAIAHPSFPTSLSAKIRVLGIEKLKARYKSFESRRQLLAQYDVFLADDRVITMLPGLLGKIGYQTSKRPVPVRLEGSRTKDESGKRIKAASKDAGTKSVAAPAAFAKEIEKALSSAQVHLAPSTTTSVRIGFSNFTPEQVSDNVEAVVKGMQEKFIPKGWRNIRSIHIKAPNSAALPIWMADEMWVQDEDVLEDQAAADLKQLDIQKHQQTKRPKGEGRKREGREGISHQNVKEKEEKEEKKKNHTKLPKLVDDQAAADPKPPGIKKGRKRRGHWGGESNKDDAGHLEKKSKKQRAQGPDASGFSAEMAERRERLRQQKSEARAAIAATA